jgi:hypothetical protein
MLDDIPTQAVSDKDDGAIRNSAECVDAADEFFGADLQTSLGRVGMPARVVIEQQDPRIRYNGRQHVWVLEPFDMETELVWLGWILPSPRPVHVGTEAVHSNDANTGKTTILLNLGCGRNLLHFCCGGVAFVDGLEGKPAGVCLQLCVSRQCRGESLESTNHGGFRQVAMKTRTFNVLWKSIGFDEFHSACG